MFENMKKLKPIPHSHAVCAPDGLSIKEYYKDYFDFKTETFGVCKIKDILMVKVECKE